tara:strand:+ start:469 stop:693 length:225 start_codon:yes stop_codon:yes gene_type:complete
MFSLGIVLFLIPFLLFILGISSSEWLLNEICNGFIQEEALEVCDDGATSIKLIEWGLMIPGFLLFVSSFFLKNN